MQNQLLGVVNIAEKCIEIGYLYPHYQIWKYLWFLEFLFAPETHFESFHINLGILLVLYLNPSIVWINFLKLSSITKMIVTLYLQVLVRVFFFCRMLYLYISHLSVLCCQNVHQVKYLMTVVLVLVPVLNWLIHFCVQLCVNVAVVVQKGNY